MEIILSKVTNPNETQRRIIEEMGKFNLEDFLCGNENGILSGLVLITENQMIMVEAFVDEAVAKTFSINPKYGNHYIAATEIYKAIYEDGEERIKDEGNRYWQSKVIKQGNILLELCAHAPSIIWVPETITETQLNNFIVINEAIKKCVRENQNYFERNPIIFDVIYEDVVDFINHNLDEVINNIEQIEGGTNERIYRTRASQKDKVRRIS